MRITEGMRVDYARAAAAQNAQRVDKATREAASGLRISAPSDDPAAYAAKIRGESRAAILEARKDAVASTADDVRIAEGVLASAGDMLVRARELSVQMSTGTVDANARKIAAGEIRSIREQLIAVANTKGARGYLFGGEKTDTAPFDAAGVFVGSANNLLVETGDGTTAKASADGARAFTSAGGLDVFATLADFATALDANDVTNIRAATETLVRAHSQLVNARVDSGLTLERLDLVHTTLDDGLLSVRTAIANRTEADPTDTYSELVNSQGAYERSLEIMRRALAMPTLASR